MRPIGLGAAVLAAACSVAGCSGSGVDLPPVAPSEPVTAESCAAFDDWAVIGPIDLLYVGSSQNYSLFPGSHSADALGCEVFITSAEWAVTEPGIVRLEPLPEVHRVRATGVSAGRTGLSVRFTMQGGQARTVERSLLVLE